MSLNRDRKKSIDLVMEEMERELKMETSTSSNHRLSVSEEIDARVFGYLQHPSRPPVPSPRPKPGKLIPSRPTDERYYDTSHARIGKALIFNQRDFDGKLTREGTNKDASDIEKVLSNLGFEVAVFRDKKYGEIMNILDQVSVENHANRDCLVVVFMSHGGDDGKIYASDFEFDVSEIWTPFVGKHCPSLIGKPKLFFIQACRGTLADFGVFMKVKPKPELENVRENSDSIDSEVAKEQTFVIPNLADLLVMYSTSEGHVSFRNPNDGSWFIQSLCIELSENSHEELLLILTGVLRRVAFNYQSDIEKNQDYDAGKQMPVFMSMLTKTFYLRKRNSTE